MKTIFQTTGKINMFSDQQNVKEHFFFLPENLYLKTNKQKHAKVSSVGRQEENNPVGNKEMKEG